MSRRLLVCSWSVRCLGVTHVYGTLQDSQGRYSSPPLKQAHEILGVTREENVDEELLSLRPAVFV